MKKDNYSLFKDKKIFPFGENKVEVTWNTPDVEKKCIFGFFEQNIIIFFDTPMSPIVFLAYT